MLNAPTLECPILRRRRGPRRRRSTWTRASHTTGRASFPASGSSKPCWLVGGQKRRAVAMGVYETVFSLVRCAGHRLDDRDRRAGGGQPLRPIARGLWLLGEERGLADRAASVLGLEEPQAGVVDRQDWFASSSGPLRDAGRGRTEPIQPGDERLDCSPRKQNKSLKCAEGCGTMCLSLQMQEPEECQLSDFG